MTMLYICTRFRDIICKCVERNNFRTKIMNGENALNYVGGVTVLVLCILSVDDLYLFKISRKYLSRF